MSFGDDDRCAGGSMHSALPSPRVVLVPDANVGVVSGDGWDRVSLEVRWVFSGGLPSTAIDWLGPFLTEPEKREDCYLIEPRLPRISLKIRGATLLDLKVDRGSRGILRLRHGGCGHLQIWEKLSFPLDATARRSIDGSRWVSVEKLRRRRSFTSVAGQAAERALSDIESPGCTVELTEVHVGGDVAWTLGFEARGPSAELEGNLRTTASYLLRDSPPQGVELGLRDSMSYMRWLRSSEIRPHVSGFFGDDKRRA